MAKFLALVIFGVFAVAQAQRGGARVNPLDDERTERRQTTTPVPILRQINKVNEDGSFTYGYESADGSYKIETRSVEGEVRGKYGYYDDVGQLREIEYVASRQGFRPSGTDVKLPESAPAMTYDPSDDSGHYDPERYSRPFANDNQQLQQQQPARRPAAAGRRPGARRPKQQQEQQFASQYSFPQSAPAPAPQQAPAYQQPAPTYQQQAPAPQNHHFVNHQNAAPAPPPAQQNYYQPQARTVAPFNPARLFDGHPAQNFDVKSGSYSVQYQG